MVRARSCALAGAASPKTANAAAAGPNMVFDLRIGGTACSYLSRPPIARRESGRSELAQRGAVAGRYVRPPGAGGRLDGNSLIWIALLMAFAAALYSSAGHGGASAYLAIMALFSVRRKRCGRLALNLVVATFATARFALAGQTNWRLLGGLCGGRGPRGLCGWDRRPAAASLSAAGRHLPSHRGASPVLAAARSLASVACIRAADRGL